MKKTINAQNWTGEKITYKNTKSGIEVFDMRFEIEKLPEVNGIPELERYQVTDEAGVTFQMDRWSENEPFMASSNGIVREGYEVDEVAAAMVANLY